MASRSLNSGHDANVAVNTKAITTSHSTMVFVSKSRKKAATLPFHTSAYSTKLTEPSSMSTMRMHSSGKE